MGAGGMLATPRCSLRGCGSVASSGSAGLAALSFERLGDPDELLRRLPALRLGGRLPVTSRSEHGCAQNHTALRVLPTPEGSQQEIRWTEFGR
jgi:hypothetical protein